MKHPMPFRGLHRKVLHTPEAEDSLDTLTQPLVVIRKTPGVTPRSRGQADPQHRVPVRKPKA